MCGLGSTPSTSTARVELQREILRVRDEIVRWGPQFKVALQEWNQAWQRRRDLEAAATLSLAGFTVSRMQFGTEDASLTSLRAKAARQRMVMEHMEGPLQERERLLSLGWRSRQSARKCTSSALSPGVQPRRSCCPTSSPRSGLA